MRGNLRRHLTLIVITLAVLHSFTLLESVAAQSPAESDEPTTGNVEVRVWQRIADPLRIYISARPEGGSWDTLGTIALPLDDGHSRSGNYRYGDVTVKEVEVRIWQRVADPLRIYISARPERGSWDTLGTIPLPLDDGHSTSGSYRYGDITVAVPLAASPGIEWLFADGISSQRRTEIQQGMAEIRDFVAYRFGARASGFTVSVGDRDPGRARAGLMATTASFWDAAHEYFHLIQYELAGGRSWGPHWLVEGSATYAEEAYDGDLEFRRAIAPAGASHVASIRETESADPVRLNYHLGFLAADWLVGHAGESSLLEFYRLLPAHDGWEDAFAAAFGLTIDEFYERFEEHRTSIAPPLPHVTDDAVTPVAVFVGNVPDHVRSEIQAEMNKVQAFLLERFGAEATEYSVYVGPDWNSVAAHNQRLSQNLWWDDRIRRHSLPLPWASGCSSGATGWVVHVTGCGHSPGPSVYINSHLRVLLEEKEQLDLPPLWLEAGAGAYIALTYGATAADVDAALVQHRASVERSTVPLAQLATPEGWAIAEDDERLALSISAMDWLLGRAGELALFDYLRLLPRGTLGLPSLVGTAESAFEQAFGLPLDDFYGQFDAYRSNLRAE